MVLSAKINPYKKTQMKNLFAFLYIVGMTIIGINAIHSEWAGAIFIIGLIIGIRFFDWSDAEEEFNKTW